MSSSQPVPKQNFISKISGINKLAISVVLGLAGYFFIPVNGVSIYRILIGWDIFSGSLLLLTWITFITTKSVHIRNESKKQDDSRVVIFIIVLIATFFGLLQVVGLLVSKNGSQHDQNLQLPVTILSMLFSWLLVHTIFTTRYAHIYYANDPDEPSKHKGGLDFPGDTKPDFMDFAYFSFVLGMTFQVSDVQITSKVFRRLALMHGFLSFVYNTFIVALTINIIAGLGSR